MEIADFGPGIPIGNRRALRFAAAVVGVLTVAMTGPALAAPENTSQAGATRSVDPDPAGAATPRPPNDLPAAKTRATTSTGSGTSGNSGRPWSIEDALPNNSPAVRHRATETPAAGLGRVPLRKGQGTLGFETETKVKQNELPDGTQLPGPEPSPRRPPSYLGLSISVPTNNNSLLPPLAPPFGRAD